MTNREFSGWVYWDCLNCFVAHDSVLAEYHTIIKKGLLDHRPFACPYCKHRNEHSGFWKHQGTLHPKPKGYNQCWLGSCIKCHKTLAIVNE